MVKAEDQLVNFGKYEALTFDEFCQRLGSGKIPRSYLEYCSSHVKHWRNGHPYHDLHRFLSKHANITIPSIVKEDVKKDSKETVTNRDESSDDEILISFKNMTISIKIEK